MWSAHASGGPARPQETRQSEAVIALRLVFQQVYRLPLRQTLGLLRSVLDLAGRTTLPAPDPSTLCRRRSKAPLPA